MARSKARTIALFALIVGIVECVYAQDASVDQLIQALQSNDATAQAKAADALAALGPEAARATDALSNTLGSDDAQVRAAAVLALAAIGPQAKSAIDSLVNRLSDSDPSVRARAAYAIGEIGDSRESTARALIHASLDEDVTVRREVRDALRTLHLPREMTLPIWAKTLNEADPEVVMPALHTLAEIGAEAVPVLRDALKDEKACYWATLVAAELGPLAQDLTPELTAMLEHQHPECRMHALVALGEIGPAAKSAAKQITELLASEAEDSVKFAGVYALSEIDDSEETKQALVKMLDSDNMELATIAARGVLQADPDGPHIDAAQKAIIRGLRSEDDDIRHLAVRTLTESTRDEPASPEVVEAFVSALADSSPAVAMEVADALGARGKEVVPRVIRGLENEQLRPLAVQVALRLGPDAGDAVPTLIKVIDEVKDDPKLLREVNFALGAIGSAAAPAVPKLIEMLQSDVPEIRTSACYALGKIGPSARAAVPALRTLARSDDPFQKLISVWALLHIVPDNERLEAYAVPLLIRALSDERAQVRAEVAESLGEIGEEAQAALPALQEAAKDDDPVVREAAETAIRKINADQPTR